MSWQTTASIRLLVIISLIAIILLLLASSVGANQARGETLEHRVVSGETLLEIASGYTPSGASVRRTVDEIRRLSGINGSVIYPGQIVTVPVHDAG